MAFTTRSGTFGARQPGRAVRWVNVLTTRIIRGNRGKLARHSLLLTTIGRKTGEPRTSPVNWFPGGDDSWLIAASAAGAAKNPAWYYNIAAAPDRVRIEIAGRVIDVRAEQLVGAEREAVWRAITAASSRFSQYEQLTDREIPVLRLTRR
jgi:deazaflavin-dependent oxidoreductase (nitroreductase family)